MIRFANDGRRRRPLGLTIFELLIAITISLIILTVMIQAFRRASSEISKGRATMELQTQLRSVGEMMRSDLAGATISTRQWTPTSEGNGYFEVVEGIRNDHTSLATAGTQDDYIGDYDDVLALTVRSDGRPFRGRWVDGTGTIQMVESNMAEIVWFVVHEDIDETDQVIDRDDLVRLYRRVLLIRPDLTLAGAATIDEFFRRNDISARPQAGGMIPNSLDDLTRRENRYCHNMTAYPFVFERAWLENRRLHELVPGDTVGQSLHGEDMVMNDVCGFDLRVYSPNAPIQTDNQFVLEPGDANFDLASSTPDVGAYVDLGWGDGLGPGATGWFSTLPHDKSGLNPGAMAPYVPPTYAASLDSQWLLNRTWDSWSAHYYATYPIINGINEDGDGQTDELDELVYSTLNGLDDDGDGIVDEEDELSVAPPYPYPIRGLRVTFKAIEKTTSSVRQLTITSGFVPE